MTSYAQSIEQRGLRVTLKLEITPEAFEHFPAHALAHATNELKHDLRGLSTDPSSPNPREEDDVRITSVQDQVASATRKAVLALTNAIENTDFDIAVEYGKTRDRRRAAETQQAAVTKALAEGNRVLSDKLLAIDEEKRKLEAQIALATSRIDVDTRTNRNLASQVDRLKAQLESRAEKVKRARAKAAVIRRAANKAAASDRPGKKGGAK